MNWVEGDKIRFANPLTAEAVRQYMNPFPEKNRMNETELRQWCLEKAIQIAPSFSRAEYLMGIANEFLNFIRNADDSKLLAAAREFAGKVKS